MQGYQLLLWVLAYALLFTLIAFALNYILEEVLITRMIQDLNRDRAPINADKFQPYMRPALYHPTKCFSCERQFNESDAWKGQKTKCFDCERSPYIATPFDAHPVRFY